MNYEVLFFVLEEIEKENPKSFEDLKRFYDKILGEVQSQVEMAFQDYSDDNFNGEIIKKEDLQNDQS